MSGDAIVHKVVYPHPVRRVWRALTESAALTEWLMPNDFEPRVGRRFTFRAEPQPGWDGVVECEVVDIDEPRRVAYTWRGGFGMPQTLVAFTLEATGGATRLRLVHSGFGTGGPERISVRDLLDSGWGTRLLRQRFPDLLERWTAAGEEAANER